MMHQALSCGPVVKRETLTLYQSALVGGKERYVDFQQEILWVRKSESQIFLTHRGAIVDGLSTYNDFYGFMASPISALGEVESRRKLLHIEIGDVLCLEVRTKVADQPLIADDTKDGREWNATADRKKYFQADREWLTKPGFDPKFGYWRLEAAVVVESELVYTTADGDEGKIAAFVERMKAELPA